MPDNIHDDAATSLPEQFWGKTRNTLEIARSNYFINTDLIGIEIELENINSGMDDYKSIFWDVIKDGSLDRSGREFVLKTPLAGKSLWKSLLSIHKVINKRGIIPYSSLRTSTHIHLDVRDYHLKDINNIVISYLLFERVLLNYCGVERSINPFSRPLHMTEGIVESLASVRRSSSNMANALHDLNDNGRYCAINLGSIAKFGSIEFRSHSGEFESHKLRNWINILLRVKEFSEGVTDWRELLGQTSERGALSLFYQVFGGDSKLLEYESLEDDIMSGIRLAQDIIYASELKESSMLESSPWKFDPDNVKISNRFSRYKGGQ